LEYLILTDAILIKHNLPGKPEILYILVDAKQFIHLVLFGIIGTNLKKHFIDAIFVKPDLFLPEKKLVDNQLNS
jgi:hypothetical protein